MNFSTTVKSKIFTLSSGLMISLCPLVDAGTLPKPIGPLQQISPTPATSPDPVLLNLQLVMADYFQPPYYPGFPPSPPFPNSNYLGGIYGQFNTYYGAGLAFNPIDDRIVTIIFARNNIVDRTGTLNNFQRLTSSIFARSVDGGLTWNYGPPIVPIIPLGGTISQVINASIGPGLAHNYLKNGNLIAYGNGAKDMHPNFPFSVPMQRALFTHSEDNGKTWAEPQILLQSDVDSEFVNASGLSWEDMTMTADPANNDHIVARTGTTFFPSTFYGNGYAFGSDDGGKTFSPPIQVYSMITDPVWLANNFDPDFTSDPNYFIFGGQLLISSRVTYVDANTILMNFLRVYPKVGSSTYTQVPSNTNIDQATLRSLDNGKTWSKSAAPIEKFISTFFAPPRDPGNNRSLNSGTYTALMVVSPYTGRVYMIYQAGNPASNSDPTRMSPYILLNVCKDPTGKEFSWGPAIQINATPTNISFSRQQAFSHNMVMTQDGSLVVTYYDLRNWTGGLTAGTPLEVDAWMAVYKETDSPQGGSTGVGLDFVGEIRLTPHSSNARISLNNGRGFGTGTPEGMPMAVNNRNQLFVVFSMSGENDPAKISTGYRGMQVDLNNRTNIFMQRFQFPRPSNQ